MAITLDTIVNKVFKVVKNGYDNNEVESFLDEILEEISNYRVAFAVQDGESDGEEAE